MKNAPVSIKRLTMPLQNPTMPTALRQERSTSESGFCKDAGFGPPPFSSAAGWPWARYDLIRSQNFAGKGGSLGQNRAGLESLFFSSGISKAPLRNHHPSSFLLMIAHAARRGNRVVEGFIS